MYHKTGEMLKTGPPPPPPPPRKGEKVIINVFATIAMYINLAEN